MTGGEWVHYCGAPAEDGPCGAIATRQAFGWPDVYRCEDCAARYIRHAGASSAVAAWVPLRTIQEYSLGSIAGREGT